MYLRNMHLDRAKITAALATAVGVVTPSSAFVVSPPGVHSGAKLIGVPAGALGDRGPIGKISEVVRSRICWNLKKTDAKQERGGGCGVMMASEGPPGEGKFVKMGGAEDVQSFGPRQALTLAG